MRGDRPMLGPYCGRFFRTTLYQKNQSNLHSRTGLFASDRLATVDI